MAIHKITDKITLAIIIFNLIIGPVCIIAGIINKDIITILLGIQNLITATFLYIINKNN